LVEELDIETILYQASEITDPEKDQLTELAIEFPWSEPIQVAWLKALYQTKDARFQKELERVAFISSDRKELYRIIYGQTLQKTIEKVEQELEELEEGIFIPEWKKAEESEIREPITEITPEEEAQIPEIEITSDLIPELAEQIKLTAADAIISKEVLEDIESHKEEKQAEKKEELTEEIQKKSEEKTEGSFTSSDDFVQWLVNKAAEIEYPSFEKKNYKKPKSKTDVESLIDNFITKDPKITPGKSREYGLEDLAKESLVDNDEFVTETLAEIYASQGNYSKAKRAFELLSLKYPEKSIYFAARIKKLGKKK